MSFSQAQRNLGADERYTLFVNAAMHECCELRVSHAAPRVCEHLLIHVLLLNMRPCCRLGGVVFGKHIFGFQTRIILTHC